MKESTNYKEFWQLLNRVLEQQHNAQPVHSTEEIEGLADSFPDNIRLFTAHTVQGDLLAGAIMYSTDRVSHAQYLANSDEGKKHGALDLVIDYLIRHVYNKYRYFDFGISTENQGLILNNGLISQKEGFGARAICHDSYKIRIR